MDQLKSYKSFLNSYYLSEGVRMTVGILVPAFIMNYVDMLAAGIVMALGAVCVSVTDIPGPIHHRRNAMLICNLVVPVVAFITGWALHSPVTLGLLLFLFCFLFSMLGAYGVRAGALGISALLAMIMTLAQHRYGWDILYNALYMMAGGLWYMGFSFLLYRIRPYKLAQQALGDYIQGIAEYLLVRAAFYKENINYQENYQKLLQIQSEVQEKQNLVNDLLFKTRSIIKESTHTGRTLVMIYLDATDLFESVMTSYHDYQALHGYFDKTSILDDFYKLATELAAELEAIGIAVKGSSPSRLSRAVFSHVREEKERFSEIRKKYLRPENLDGFIGLRRIFDNIQDIAERLYTLHQYTRSNHKMKRKTQQQLDFSKLVMHQTLHPRILVDNLSLRSNIFRHSLRVSISILAGYLISLFFPLGHSYWILLTVVVILKPAYSLTKKRNADRLIGTFLGILLGVLILYSIKNDTALLAIMIVLMAGCYTFIRKKYLIGVFFMTPYILIFSDLLYPQDLRTLFTDRMVDTIIGSVIAFITSSLLIPSWEHETIKSFMINILRDNIRYFRSIATGYHSTDVVPLNKYAVARKDSLVSLANLSDAFTRMLSEPRSQQKGKEEIHQFVALSHRFISHVATLSYYMQRNINTYRSPHFKAITDDIIEQLNQSISLLEGKTSITIPSSKEALRLLNEEENTLMEKRKEELKRGMLETDTKKELLELKSLVDQFNFINNIVTDLQKICSKLNTF